MYKSEHLITSKHYLVLCSISFTVGIFLFVYLNSSLLRAFAAFLFAFELVLVVLIMLRGIKILKIRLKYLLMPTVLILFMFLGIAKIYITESPVYNTLLTYENEAVWLYGQVLETPKVTSLGYSYSFELEVVQVNSDSNATGTIVVYLPADRPTIPAAGDRICCWTELSAPSRAENKEDFDYYTYLRGRNIFLTGKTRNVNLIDYDKNSGFVTIFKDVGFKIRNRLSETIDTMFPYDAESAAILKGILFGDKSGFTDDLYSRFSNSGISHIVAVSGLHISILFSFLTLVLSGGRKRSKIAMTATVPFILLFISVSAFSPSVCRAAIMLLITVLAALINEDYDPISALFLAFGIILAIAPYALFSRSLLLSFAATLGIFAYYNYILRIISKPFGFEKLPYITLKKLLLKASNFVLSSISLSAASLFGTAYFLVLFFGKISKVQFLTNLWCIPLVSIIFCLGYANCFVYMLFPDFTLNILQPILKMALGIIKQTVYTFGDDKFSFIISNEALSADSFIIYMGCAVMLYFFLKLFYDIDKGKELKKCG